MGDGPNYPDIQTVTIDTMLNNNGLNIGDGVNFFTCEQGVTFLLQTSSSCFCFVSGIISQVLRLIYIEAKATSLPDGLVGNPIYCLH